MSHRSDSVDDYMGNPNVEHDHEDAQRGDNSAMTMDT